jgi:glycosyltransferase involved in cell wall biosynthesis
MDLYLSPFHQGVSTRRGSFLVGLQHGIATVSTTGEQTDPLLRAQHESAVLLAPDDDPDRFASQVVALAQDNATRSRIARAGRTLFDTTFAWPRIADAMLEVLSKSPRSRPRPTPAAASRTA